MKKGNLLITGSLVVLLGIGSAAFFNTSKEELQEKPQTKQQTKQQTKPTSSALSVPGFENLKDLKKAANTIVVATVSSKFEETESLIVGEPSVYQVDHVYTVKVEKGFKDSGGNKFKKGDLLEITVPIGARQKKDGKVGDLLPFSDEPLYFEDGKYLLFLTSSYSSESEKMVYMPTNIEHTYKFDDIKKKYKNISSDKTPYIEEIDISSN